LLDEHPITGRTQHVLATLYKETGAYSQAEALLRQVIVVQRKAPSAAGDLSISLVTLGLVYSDMGRHAEAEPLCREALELAERTFGAQHLQTRTALRALGSLYRRMGNYENAEPLLERAIALGREARETAGAIYSLADLYADAGAHRKAQPLYQRAIAIYDGTLGPEHPESADVLQSLAVLHWALGESQQALSMLQRVQRIQTNNANRFLATGSEVRKQNYLRKSAASTFDAVSFAMSTPGSAATALGLTSVLQHKGRVLDGMSDSVARLRRSVAPADQALLEQLADVASQLSALAYGKEGRLSIEQYRERVTQLAAQQEQLETELSARSQAFSREVTPVTLANVKRAIPANAVLVEWFRYTPCGPKRKSFTPRRGPPRYVAYVLKRTAKHGIIN
jgi:tetratricopeptide (TPR) repeat protein